jgi:hypothetical protein
MFLFILLLSSSCVGSYHPPEGVWKSEDPDMIIYLKREYVIKIQSGGYPGVIFEDGIEKKSFIFFLINHPTFSIYDITDIEYGSTIGTQTSIFSGEYRIKNNQMTYKLYPISQERTGYEQIIFTKLDDYPPINPQDWIPVEVEEEDEEAEDVYFEISVE